jgi:hypothetical protein
MGTTDRAGVADVAREEWPSWCARTSSELGGRELVLHRADQATGEVRLAKGQRLVAIEHDRFGRSEVLTIKCGSDVVPVSYVVAEPRSIRQTVGDAGDVQQVSIVDAVGRRTRVTLA